MSDTSQRILVTGATGQLGTLIVQQLIEQGQPAARIVAAGRDTEKLSRFADLGVDTAIADYEQPDTLSAAFSDVDTVVLVSSSEVGKRADQHRNVIEAAKQAGVQKLVYTSLPKADVSTNPLAPEHRATEEAIRDSGIPFVIVRNNWYTENYVDAANQARTTGAVVANAADGKVASATRNDYAAGIAVVALADEHTGRTYEFGGDEAWGYPQLAEAIGEAIGSEVEYRAVSASDHVELLQQAGLDAGTAQFVAGIDESIARGDLAVADGTLSRLIGRPTTPLREGIQTAL